LTTSRRRKDSVFERAQCALFLVDEQGRVLQANRRAVELTGISRRELEETEIDEVLQPVQWNEVWSRLQEVGTKSHRIRFNSALSSRRGDPIQVEAFARIFQTARTPKSALVRARDTREESFLRDRLQERIRRASISHERDRKRIARTLHDSTINDLLATMAALDTAICTASGTQVEPQLQEVKESVNQVVSSVRGLIGRLRADELENGDLVSGLEALLSTLESRGVKTGLAACELPCILNKHARLLIYRVAQEALRNAERHSRASTVVVTLECEDQWLSLSIADDGTGFLAPSSEADAAHVGALGLQGAYERASLLGGGLNIDSVPGKGTVFLLRAPLSVVCEQSP